METVNLTFKSEHTEFREAITKFITSSNPSFHVNIESIVDAIATAFIATNNIRLGPAPTIESQFFIRQVIRYYVNENKPIPILVPCGPKKTKNGESIDLAELSMLNILNCLNKEVKLHHPAGLDIVMRLEDMTGLALEPENTEDMKVYINEFSQLVRILDYDFITPWKESFSPNVNNFIPMIDKFHPLFIKYIQDSQNIPEEEWNELPSYKILVELGWQGIIPNEQRLSYIQKYAKLYPELSEDECITLMCRYFTAGLVRKNINMKGNKETWTGGFLEIAFMQPYHLVYPTRINYRSIELKNSKKALSFWRAKGFLKISNNNIRISSCTWNEAETLDFYRGVLIFKRGTEEVQVNCDYILE